MRKALVVDDHPFIRSTVKMILAQENFEVMAEACNGADAVQLAREHEPDLIVLDIAMPKLDGLETLSRLVSLDAPVKVLVLTSQAAEFYSMRCMKAGATGYVSKTDDLDELIRAIRMIMSGYTCFPNLSVNTTRRQDLEKTELALIGSLTDRELTILQQLSRGFSNKQIGEELLLSNKTISTYKTRIIEKLELPSLVQLSEFAKRNGLV
ncbi:response regulator [Pseudomonas sp. L1(2025)]|uniref:response regulator n=1 Tax=Pseudomonas sp. L1(2025) TaxID=3449429 RepID=UPI003F68DB77